jgi:hypothetical protein
MKLRAASAIFAVLVGGVVGLTWPDHAQAGFGRRGSAQSSPSRSSSASGGSRSSSSSASSSGFGRSSSYRESGYARGSRDGGYRRGSGWSPGYRAYPRSWGYPVWGYGFGYVPSYPVAPIIVDGQYQTQPAYGTYDDERMVAAAIAGDFTVGTTGPLLGAQLSIEGERLGVLFGYTAAFAPIAGTPQFDTLHLLLGHFTYAFIASERVRVRAELGLHIADAPLVTFVAPGVGLSAAFGLAGPLGLEARVFGNAWPYTQLDARAGLTLTLGSIGLGAGLRALYLSDNGVLGETNAEDTSDKFIGPYVTLAVAL